MTTLNFGAYTIDLDDTRKENSRKHYMLFEQPNLTYGSHSLILRVNAISVTSIYSVIITVGKEETG